MAMTGASDLWAWSLEGHRTLVKFAETTQQAQAAIFARLPLLAAAIWDPFGDDISDRTTRGTSGVSGRPPMAGHDAIRDRMLSNAQDLGRAAGGDILWPADWMRIAERNLDLFAMAANLSGRMLARSQQDVSRAAR